MNNKAAMFGLDARIALAIFGALSVITGASLFSAIKEAKTVSMLTSLDNLSKAIEAYYLDIGSDLPYFTTSASPTVNASHLLNDYDSAYGWKGPYMESASILSEIHFTIDTLGIIFINACDDTFGDQLSRTSCLTCVSGQPCNLWIKASGAKITQAFAKSLDDKVDSSDGYDAGNVRVLYADATKTDNIRLFFKSKIKN